MNFPPSSSSSIQLRRFVFVASSFGFIEVRGYPTSTRAARCFFFNPAKPPKEIWQNCMRKEVYWTIV
jgi:hypothetical protein